MQAATLILYYARYLGLHVGMRYKTGVCTIVIIMNGALNDVHFAVG